MSDIALFPFSPTTTFLCYDTETSGLPLFKEASAHPDQPRIIQLTALLCDGNGNKLSSIDTLVHHEGLVLTDEIVNLTGITDGRCRDGGVPIGAALGQFLAMWRKATVRVAHNQSFDARMVRIELKRDGQDALADEWKEAPSFCTMQATRPILRLPPTAKMKATARFAEAFKSPNLKEAYRWATGKDLVGAHNAMVDVIALKTVLFALAQFHKTMAPKPSPVTKPRENVPVTGDDGDVGAW